MLTWLSLIKHRFTGVLVVPARRLLVQRLPLVGALLADFDDVALDLVSPVVSRLTPRQRHRVLVHVLDEGRARLSGCVCDTTSSNVNNSGLFNSCGTTKR